jgi:hypothetical protein
MGAASAVDVAAQPARQRDEPAPGGLQRPGTRHHVHLAGPSAAADPQRGQRAFALRDLDQAFRHERDEVAAVQESPDRRGRGRAAAGTKPSPHGDPPVSVDPVAVPAAAGHQAAGGGPDADGDLALPIVDRARGQAAARRSLRPPAASECRVAGSGDARLSAGGERHGRRSGPGHRGARNLVLPRASGTARGCIATWTAERDRPRGRGDGSCRRIAARVRSGASSGARRSRRIRR